MASPLAKTVKFEVETSLNDENQPLNKRSRVLPQKAAERILLDEPSPLGLRLRKSPSLLELIQMRLEIGASTSTSGGTSSRGGSNIGKRKGLSLMEVSSSSSDKLKASNFPVSVLRIGTWEYVSRYEGDLVGKCYFAKHKLVWEVLEGGLKNKIEIQWSDITGLSATFADDGVSSTLNVVVARPPLFFRETDPQPRKHTLWQATQDFTDGQASINRRHFLQCEQGLLRKNFEKLVQCDPCLYSLSQQPEIALESLYFEHQRSVFEDQDENEDHALVNRDYSYISRFSVLHEPAFIAAESIATKSVLPDSVGTALDFASHGVLSPCSGIQVQNIEEKTCKEMEERNHHNWWEQLKVLGIRASMSVNDLVNHLEQHISNQLNSGNASFSSDDMPTKEMLEIVAQFLLNDSQSTMADEKTLLSKVNSFCSLLQEDTGGTWINYMDNDENFQQIVKSEVGPDSGDEKPFIGGTSSMSRKESFGELLSLPRIASLRHFLLNFSENGHNKAR